MYLKMIRPLTYFASKLTGDEAASEDIASSVLISYIDKQDIDLEGEGMRALLYTAVRNRCVDHFRRLRTHEAMLGKLQEDILANKEDGFCDRALIRAELLQRIQLHVDKLPGRMKAYVQAYLANEKPAAEIAEEFNVAYSTYVNHRNKGIVMLIRMLKEDPYFKLILWAFLHFQWKK